LTGPRLPDTLNSGLTVSLFIRYCVRETTLYGVKGAVRRNFMA